MVRKETLLVQIRQGWSRWPLAAAGLSGLLAGGVFSLGFPGILLPLFIAPVLYYFIDSVRKRTRRESLIFTATFFAVFYAVVLYWFTEADMSLLVGADGGSARLLLALCQLIMVGLWTLLSLPLGMLFYYLQERMKRPDVLSAAIIGSAWVGIEWLRSIGFSVFLYASEATIGDYWNFGSLGLGLMDTPLKYLAQLIGMYGLSFLVVIIALAICWAIRKRPKLLLVTIGTVLLATGLGAYAINQATGRNIEASVMQQETRLPDFNGGVPIRHARQTKKQLILVPEYSDVFGESSADFAKEYVHERLAHDGVSVNVSADFSPRTRRFGTLEVRNAQGQVVVRQTKQLLIPTGEYLPLILQVFFQLTGQARINQNFADTRLVSRGDEPAVVRTDILDFAPVACSGILGRNIYRDLVNQGGEVLTNSASLVVFNRSEAYFRQSRQIARFHALANHRSYIQASKGAPGFVIGPDGNDIVAPDTIRTSFTDFSFTAYRLKTPYTLLGEWVLIASCMVLVGTLLKVLIGRKKA